MKNFNSSALHSHSQSTNHIRERNSRKYSLLSVLPLRFSLRGYGFCMATLFLFCFGSLFYQLNGGPPKILLDIRQYLGKNFSFKNKNLLPEGRYQNDSKKLLSTSGHFYFIIIIFLSVGVIKKRLSKMERVSFMKSTGGHIVSSTSFSPDGRNRFSLVLISKC